MNFPSIIFVFKHKNQIILNFSSNNGIYEKDISSKIDQISNFLISDPIYNIFWSKIRQCTPLRVMVVPLKPRNFCKIGRLEILEISLSGFVFWELDCFDKYQMYRNCYDISKFLELPEITKRNGNSGQNPGNSGQST